MTPRTARPAAEQWRCDRRSMPTEGRRSPNTPSSVVLSTRGMLELSKLCSLATGDGTGRSAGRRDDVGHQGRRWRRSRQGSRRGTQPCVLGNTAGHAVPRRPLSSSEFVPPTVRASLMRRDHDQVSKLTAALPRQEQPEGPIDDARDLSNVRQQPYNLPAGCGLALAGFFLPSNPRLALSSMVHHSAAALTQRLSRAAALKSAFSMPQVWVVRMRHG